MTNEELNKEIKKNVAEAKATIDAVIKGIEEKEESILDNVTKANVALSEMLENGGIEARQVMFLTKQLDALRAQYNAIKQTTSTIYFAKDL